MTTNYDNLTDEALSAEVAEKVFGPKPPLPTDCDDPLTIEWVAGWIHTHDFDHGDVCEYEAPPYASDINFSFQVVEKLRAKGYGVTISDGYFSTYWQVNFVPREGGEGTGQHQSLPRAICLAALAAVEGKE